MSQFMYLKVLYGPDLFFKDIKGKCNSKWMFLIISLLFGLILLSSTMSAYTVLSAFSPAQSVPLMMVSSFVGSVVTAAGGSFLSWIIYSAFFGTISHFLGGRGGIKELFHNTSFGFIPTLISQVLRTLMILLFVAPTASSLSSADEAITCFLTNPYTITVSVLDLFFLLWSANIWVFAVKHARNLTTRNAVITVAIPVGAMMTYSICQILRVI